MKYLIIGRSGVGKDYIAKLLHDMYNMKILLSYTTRPKRFENENTHIFIDKSDVINYKDKIASTVINGYEYFSTKTQLDNSDIYIIDPNGLNELLSNTPNEEFCILYISVLDKELHTKMAINRSKDTNKELEIFNNRYNDENEQFCNFEDKISNINNFPKNVKNIIQIYNNYNKEELQYTLKQIFDK